MSLILADARHLPLTDKSVQCCVTSPPYFGLRDYGTPNQIGLEPSPDAYVSALVEVFREVRRVLKDDGVLWLNLGDSYTSGGRDSFGTWAEGSKQATHTAIKEARRAPQPEGLKPKDLIGVPWRVAFALQADGWYLRSDIIWSKPNPMPESVTDRPTKAHEYLFLLAKSQKYYYDAQAIAEPVSGAMLDQMEQGYDGLGLKDHEAAGVQNPSSVKARIIANAQRKNEQSGDRRKVGFNDRWDAAEYAGKHGDADEQSASRRMLLNAKANRDNGAPHDAPFGLTRNKRTVWTIPTMPYAGAHFATMPEALVEPCVLAGSRLGDRVLDPFMGSGTVGAVCDRIGRRWVGTDLNAAYHTLAAKRTAQRGLRFTAVDEGRLAQSGQSSETKIENSRPSSTSTTLPRGVS